MSCILAILNLPFRHFIGFFFMSQASLLISCLFSPRILDAFTDLRFIMGFV